LSIWTCLLPNYNVAKIQTKNLLRISERCKIFTLKL